MSVTLNGNRTIANSMEATSIKRYQSVELYLSHVEYIEKCGIDIPKEVSRTHYRTHLFDPSSNCVEDVIQWVKDLESERAWDVWPIAILDGFEIKLFDFWILDKIYIATYRSPMCCPICNSVFFNTSIREYGQTYRQLKGWSDIQRVIYPNWKTYCSKECRVKHNQVKLSERRKSERIKTAIACEACKQAFLPKRSTAKYCSTRCRVAAHRQGGGQ